MASVFGSETSHSCRSISFYSVERRKASPVSMAAGRRVAINSTTANVAVVPTSAPVAAAASATILDAKGKELKRKEFLEAYHKSAKRYDEEEENSPDGVLFCKDARIDPDKFVSHCPRGVVLVRKASNDSLWDALIRKVPNAGHEAAVTELARQLGNYAVGMRRFSPGLQAGGGHTKVPEVTLENDEEVLPENRVDPDQALRVVGEMQPRVVIEVELSNRNPLPLVKHVQRLFKGWENLRCVIGLKFYKRNEEGAGFACVCFVWKKKDNMVSVERVFDIGPKASQMTSKGEVAEYWKGLEVEFKSSDDGDSFDVETPPITIDYPLPGECPEDLEDYFTISVDKEDVYHGYAPITETVGKKRKKTDLNDDEGLKIDLYEMLQKIDVYKTKNFEAFKSG